MWGVLALGVTACRTEEARVSGSSDTTTTATTASSEPTVSVPDPVAVDVEPTIAGFLDAVERTCAVSSGHSHSVDRSTVVFSKAVLSESVSDVEFDSVAVSTSLAIRSAAIPAAPPAGGPDSTGIGTSGEGPGTSNPFTVELGPLGEAVTLTEIETTSGIYVRSNRATDPEEWVVVRDVPFVSLDRSRCVLDGKSGLSMSQLVVKETHRTGGGDDRLAFALEPSSEDVGGSRVSDVEAEVDRFGMVRRLDFHRGAEYATNQVEIELSELAAPTQVAIPQAAREVDQSEFQRLLATTLSG